MEATEDRWTVLPLVGFDISPQVSNASVCRVGAGEFLAVSGSGPGSSLVALAKRVAPCA